MVRKLSVGLVLAGAIVVGGAGCKKDMKDDSMSSKKADMKPATKTLYLRLGGEPAITAVVDEFVAVGAADPKVNFTRQGKPNQWDPTPANVAKLKKHLVQFIAMATGGPNAYQGRDMVTSHKGMMISDAEFNALAADLAGVLDKLKVPKKEKDELLAIVGSTRADIVGK